MQLSNRALDYYLFRSVVTDILEDCALGDRISDQIVNEVLHRLSNENELSLFAHYCLARYYVSYAYHSGKYSQSLKLAREEINICIKRTEADYWSLSDSRDYATTYYNLVHVPYFLFFYDAGRILIICSRSKEAPPAAIKYFKHSIHAHIRSRGGASYTSLLSFRKYSEFFLSDLIEEKVTVMPPSAMNDCIDSLFFPWLDNKRTQITKHLSGILSGSRVSYLKRQLKALDVYRDALRFYRIRCFIDPGEKLENVKNPLMWAHYANEHKGLAVLYKFSNQEMARISPKSSWKFHPIRYAAPNQKVDLSGDYLDLGTAFLMKSNEWSYEKEVRLASYDTTSSTDYLQLKVGTIDSIFFGIRCPKQTIDTVMQLLNHYSQGKVKFYQMETDITNIYKFKYHSL